MLKLPSGLKIYIASEPVNMLNSFNGLSQITEDILKKDPLSGHMFVFFNKRKDMVKILYWDLNGFCIWYKRLEKGVFRIPRTQDKVFTLSSGELNLLLEGIDLTDKNRFSSLDFSNKK